SHVLRWSTGDSASDSRLASWIPDLVLAHLPELPPAPKSAEFPGLELAFHSSVAFAWPDPAGLDNYHHGPHPVAVDREARAWMTHFSANAASACGRDGGLLFARDGTLLPYRPSAWLAVREDGGLVECAGERVLEFAPDGEIVRDSEERSPPRSLFAPGRE